MCEIKWIINASTICLLFLITSFFFHSFPSTSLIFFPFLPLTTILQSSPDCYITLRSKLFSYLCLYSSFPLSRCRCPFLFCRHSSTDPHFSSSPPSLRFFYTFLYLFFFGVFPLNVVPVIVVVFFIPLLLFFLVFLTPFTHLPAYRQYASSKRYASSVTKDKIKNDESYLSTFHFI